MNAKSSKLNYTGFHLSNGSTGTGQPTNSFLSVVVVSPFFDVLLTVHLSIILAINQLNTQNLLYNTILTS